MNSKSDFHDNPELPRHQKIALQAMGIDIYVSHQPKQALPAITKKSWFADLLSLLNITEQDCEFSDSLTIAFDSVNKQLVLPITISDDDAGLKKQIWQRIKDDIPR